MFNAVFTEFLKLRRSRMLLLVVVTGLMPSLVRFLQGVFGKSSNAIDWNWFLTTHREIMVLCVLASVVLVSGFIFSMEYQYKTASYIFTSSVSKIKIFVSKMLSLLAVITLLQVVSAFGDLLFGFLLVKEGIPSNLMLKFVEVIGWYIFAYFLISIIVVMIVVLMKKFVVSSVIVLGYLMMVFPFHLKGNPYICPFMSPTIVASKLFNSPDYIFSNYYKDISINNFGISTFLITIAVISMIVGIAKFKKVDTR